MLCSGLKGRVDTLNTSAEGAKRRSLQICYFGTFSNLDGGNSHFATDIEQLVGNSLLMKLVGTPDPLNDRAACFIDFRP